MARREKATPEGEKVRSYLEGVAKNLVERLYGPAGPAWSTKLTELEDVAWRPPADPRAFVEGHAR